MSRERLDQILVRKGVATEEQIRLALMRQKTHGGRLGTHLLYYKIATEAQLLQALEEQFDCPGIELTGREVPADVTARVPLKLMDAKGLFPFRFDPDTRTLHLAMVDPGDQEAIHLAQQASAAREVKPYVAVETAVRNAVNVHCHGRPWDDTAEQIVEMPDLFGEETDPLPSPAADTARDAAAGAAGPRQAVLVTRKSFLKTFLVPIFEREGWILKIVCGPEELDSLLEGPPPERVLLSEEMAEAFLAWRERRACAGGSLPFPVDVPRLTSVSECILERTLPHPQVIASLLLTLEQTAEMQCRAAGWTPPYATMQEEAADLARAMGLGPAGEERLRLATLLLVPAPGARWPGSAPGGDLTADGFHNVADSLNRARSAFSAWGVDACLRAFLDLLAPPARDPAAARGNDVPGPDAQILAVVWYRHLAFPRKEIAEATDADALRCGLRALEARGVSPEIVEAYLRALARARRTHRPWTRHDVFLIFKKDAAPMELAARLRGEGFSVLELEEVAEARHLCNRKPPDVIVIHHDAFQETSASFCREVRRTARTLLFAVTDQARTSVVLRLLDAGFEDVFSSPFNLDLVASRIHNALEGTERRERMALARKGFSGSFRDLPFVDLIQALALSRRSARIDLEHESGERACIHLRDGNLAHASCGDLAAEPAVYRVIAWGDAGTFRLEAAEAYPPDNIHAPTDFVLLEGVRRLDEGAA